MRLIGLEPTRREAPDPKSGVSTNFTTGACLIGEANQKRCKDMRNSAYLQTKQQRIFYFNTTSLFNPNLRKVQD